MMGLMQIYGQIGNHHTVPTVALRWMEVTAMPLIDKDDLWEQLNDEPWFYNVDRDEIALPIVDAAPTVDAEVVVRCKDCKHYDMGVCLKIYSDGNAHPEAWQSRKPEDFCSYGERKGKNETERT